MEYEQDLKENNTFITLNTNLNAHKLNCHYFEIKISL